MSEQASKQAREHPEAYKNSSPLSRVRTRRRKGVPNCEAKQPDAGMTAEVVAVVALIQQAGIQ